MTTSSAAFNTWADDASRVPIEDELARRGIKLPGKIERAGPCPKCGGDDRFSINTAKQVFNCRGCQTGGDVIDLVRHLDGLDFVAACTTLTGRPPPNGKDTAAPEPREVRVANYIYRDESGSPLFAVARYEYQNLDGSFVLKDGKRKKTFKQRRPDPANPGGSIPNVEGVRVIPYRLPGLIEAIGNGHTVLIVEGEAKVDLLWSWNVPATCNAAGAKKWRAEHAEFLRNADVVIIPDNDDAGRDHADVVAKSLQEIAKSVRVLELPGLGPKGDTIDWTNAGGTVEQLHDLIAREARPWTPCPDQGQAPQAGQEVKPDTAKVQGISLDDFYAYMPMHNYIYIATREPWPGSSVNARLGPVTVTGEDGKPVLDDDGKPVKISASKWLDQNKPVSQMTWAPGEPLVIHDRLIAHGGWIERPGEACFNVYLPPTIVPGNAAEVDRWLEHAHKIYPTDADHIIKWLAHRVQRPAEKINHALLLGGNQGIGKDTLLEPAKRAVGPWNFTEVVPSQTTGRFNGFLKSVILRVNEARDQGEVNRYQFYEHMKAYTASPPDVLRVDEKNLREHSIINCCGVIITTNHKTDGIYLPADDRRHYVAWSSLSKADFDPSYWNDLWSWYLQGGHQNVTAYLQQLDISSFDHKAPPPQTAAFWDIVSANRAPEDAELADILDHLGNPDAVTLNRVQAQANGDFGIWINDRKNRRVIGHRFENCDYTPVRNDAAKDGLWKISGKRCAVYAKSNLSPADQIRAVRRLTTQ
jgi:hypothetical protein